MSATDYQPSNPAVSYQRPSTIERQASEQLAQANHTPGPIDLSHDATGDQLPD